MVLSQWDEEANDWDELGFRPGFFFSRTMLEGASPPTVGSFLDGSAYALDLKVARRVIQLSWVQHTELED